jgi:hypothetical protein
VCYSVLKVTTVTDKDNQKNHFAVEELLLLLLGLFSKGPVKCCSEITLTRFETGLRDIFSLDVPPQSILDLYTLFVKIHFNIIFSSTFTCFFQIVPLKAYTHFKVNNLFYMSDPHYLP